MIIQNSKERVPSSIGTQLLKAVKESSAECYCGNWISNIICSFDIETTNVDNNTKNVVYSWTFGYLDYKEAYGKSSEEILNMIKCVSGRTMKQFDELSKMLYEAAVASKRNVVCYIQNLGYELDRIMTQCEFNRSRYNPEKSLFLSAHQPLTVVIGNGECGIQYKDSAKLLNSDLRNAALMYGFKKLDYDYDKARFAESDLTEEEWEYNTNDVLITIGCVCKMGYSEGYKSLAIIPATYTGRTRYANRHNESINAVKEKYIRKTKGRSQVREFTTYDEHKKIAKTEKLEDKAIEKTSEEFTGAMTHANRFKAFTVVENVVSCDFVSDYPSIMVGFRFPYKVTEQKEDMLNTVKRLHRLNSVKLGTDIVKGGMEKYGNIVKSWFACTLVFGSIKSKVFEAANNEKWDMPLLSISKALNDKKETAGWIVDNGRVLEAHNAKYTLNSIDLLSLSMVYDFDIVDVEWLEIAQKMEPMDDFKINTIKKWYDNKNAWKHVKRIVEDEKELKKEDFFHNNEYLVDENTIEGLLNWYKKDPKDFLFYVNDEYTKTKNRLNGQYGILVMAIKRDRTQCVLLDSGYDYVDAGSSNTKQTEIYRHGVCITSYARYVITLFSRFVSEHTGALPVYWDTDSVKLALNGAAKEKVHEAVNIYNEHVTKVRDDIPSELGYMDDNDGYYEKFISLGCKRYIVEEKTKSGEMIVDPTVAGLPKKAASNFFNKIYTEFDKDFDMMCSLVFKPNTFISENATKKLIPLHFKPSERPMVKGDYTDCNGKICHVEELSGYPLVNTGFALCDLSEPENMVYWEMTRECQGKTNFEVPQYTITKNGDGYDIVNGKHTEIFEETFFAVQ